MEGSGCGDDDGGERGVGGSVGGDGLQPVIGYGDAVGGGDALADGGVGVAAGNGGATGGEESAEVTLADGAAADDENMVGSGHRWGSERPGGGWGPKSAAQ